MKNTFKIALLFLGFGLALQSCEDKNDNEVADDIAVNNFIWKGLNLYYLWQANVPNLSDYRFTDQDQLNRFLYGYPNPETLFQDLIYKPISKFPAPGEAIDRFSVIFPDYTQLEGILSGTTENNGVEFGLYYKDDTHAALFGVVRYILPNSDAASKDIHRGDIFYAVDGEILTPQNFNEALGRDSYTLSLANYDDGAITPNGQSVSLTKNILSENPVYINTVITSDAHKIGYLMYNGFYPNYETQLNNAFGSLKAQGITELVLDLRYNSGGSVDTATRLASMITGQFTGQIFAHEQWNAKVQLHYSETNPARLFDLFTSKINSNALINSLNLTKVYVLTSRSTASASELVINGLEPYIDVVVIGGATLGKNVGSVTLYDSPTFTKKDISTKHRYAMQPLVFKVVNKVGFGDYINGLTPDDEIYEDFGNLGTLGDPGEPLLNAAITRIVAGGRHTLKKPVKVFRAVKNKSPLEELKNGMYRTEIPEGFNK